MATTPVRKYAPAAGAALLLVALIAWFGRPGDSTSGEPPLPPLGTPGAPTTSRADLTHIVGSMEARLASKPSDVAAAVTLADALLRQTRVAGNPGLAMRAEAVLKSALHEDPLDYSARRMLAAVYLSQHRFREAIEAAERCRQMHDRDAWVYGVLGDAHVELGNYDAAFDAFDRMSSLRPNAAAYARSSYAHELQGDLNGALKLMQMATEATSPQDPESIAWHRAQMGHLYLEMGRLAEAAREYEHAEFAFPGHPFASDGLSRVAAARGDYAVALQLATPHHPGPPTPGEAALTGDLLTALGRTDEAERQYRLAEAGWQSDSPDPSRLARFLAERGRRLDDAVSIAEGAWATRHDIFTADALAWAYFKSGQIEKAKSASREALRTGSRDRELLYHAAAIAHAAGDNARAEQLVARSLDGNQTFDVISAPAAMRLRDELQSARQVASR